VDQKAFVEAEPGSWWLIDPRTDAPWSQARKDLVEPKGWQEPYWLEEQSKLSELFQELELKAPQLLRELDDLRESDDDRIAWIVAAQSALAPVKVDPAAEAAPAPAPEANVEVAAVAEAPKKKAAGLFAKKVEQQEEQDAAQAAAAGQTEVPPHVTESVARVIESMSGDASSELAAELGLSEEELAELASDPEFERMVHEEAARLHAASN
jgi:hypothetical protein